MCYALTVSTVERKWYCGMKWVADACADALLIALRLLGNRRPLSSNELGRPRPLPFPIMLRIGSVAGMGWARLGLKAAGLTTAELLTLILSIHRRRGFPGPSAHQRVAF